jgi:hypothetical protein
MKRPLVLGAAAAMLVAVAVSPSLVAAPAAPTRASRPRAGTGFVPLPPAAPAGQIVLFGHIVKLTHPGSRFLLRFDPAWFTSGLTANVAAAEDGVVPKGQPVPNDNYVVEEGHRALTFIVPPGAHVTVLTNEATAGIRSTRISVAELAQIVRHRNPKRRKLFESLDSGVWIRVRIDTVRSIDQQYRP